MRDSDLRSSINEQLTALAHQVKSLEKEDYAKKAPELIRNAEKAILRRIPDRAETLKQEWPEMKTIKKLDKEPLPSFAQKWKEKGKAPKKTEKLSDKKGPDRDR